MTGSEPAEPLLEGRGFLPVRHVAELTDVRLADLVRLVEAGLVPGALLAEDGTAYGVLDDALPTREQLLELGAVSADGLPEPEPPDADGTGHWEMSWSDPAPG